MIRNRKIFFFNIIYFFFCFGVSHAQEMRFTVRDEMMLMAIEQLSEKQQLLAAELPLGSREEAILNVIDQLEDGAGVLNKPREDSQAQRSQRGKNNTPGLGLVNSYIKKFTSRIHPYLSAQSNFNDNVNMLRKKRSSLQYYTKTGVRGSQITKSRSSFNWDVLMSNNYYERNAEHNTQSLTVGSQLNFGVKRNTFSIANSYNTNYIADESFGIKTDKQVCYWSDTLGLSWGKHFNRIGFDLGAAHSDANYEEDYDTFDATTDSFSISPHLFLGRKSRLSLAYLYRRSEREKVALSESRSNSFNLELAGVVSPKITGAFIVDYDLLDNKSSNDSKTRSFGLSFAYRISNRSSLSMDLNHLVYDTAARTFSYTTEDSFSLTGKHRLAFNPRLSFNFSSGVLYKDYPKWEGTHNDYSVYSIGLGLGYAFRQWFDLSLSWKHTRKYSNIDTNYNQNTVVFSSSARF